MRLTPPQKALPFDTLDIYGERINLADYAGRKVMLCFFRDAACPFCNFRVYELTHKYKLWKQQGVEVIAVFCSPDEEVRQYVARHPRPFKLVADPDLHIYNQYGVEKSAKAAWKAMFFKIPTIIKGFMTGGRVNKNNPYPTLVPADFLINEFGRVEDTWYGRNTSDHIPLERVDAFIKRRIHRKPRSKVSKLQFQ